MGTATTRVLSGPCILPGAAADGFRFPEPHPTPHGGAAFASQPPTVPRGRLPSPTTRPSVSGHRVRARSEGLQQPQAPALLASSPDPARLPSSAFSAPHLLRRHRPLPRAAPAALPRATAALRHLRRPGASGAQRRPRVTSARGAPPARPAPPPPGRSRVRPLRVVPAVSSRRASSPPAGRGESACGALTCAAEMPALPGQGGRVNGRVGARAGPRVPAPPV